MRAKTGILGVVAAAALSTVSNGAFAGLCPAGGAVGSTLDAYIALGAVGCQIGDKTFSNFSYNGDGTGVLANQVGVTPDATGNLGVQLNGAWGDRQPGSTMSQSISLLQLHRERHRRVRLSPTPPCRC